MGEVVQAGRRFFMRHFNVAMSLVPKQGFLDQSRDRQGAGLV
jgi:hypothetical protein